MTAFALRRAVRRLRRQRIRRATTCCAPRRSRPVAAEQVGERQAGDAAAEAAEQLAARVDQLLEVPARRAVAMMIGELMLIAGTRTR